MGTTVAYQRATDTLVKENAKNRWHDLWEAIEFNRMGIGIMVLMAALIPAGIAAAFTLNMGAWEFAIVLALAMFTLTMVLGLTSMRLIFAVAGLTILVSLIIIIAGLMQTGGMLENF